jgi:hypothetical protein
MYLAARLWGWAIAIAIAGWARPAVAQRTVYQVDGAVNVGYSQTTRPAPVTDPTASAGDTPDSTLSAFFTELRPGLTVSTGSARYAWRFGYTLTAVMNLSSTDVTAPSGEKAMSTATDQNVALANQANAALAAQLTQFTTVTLNAAVSQGGTSFLLSHGAAEAGKPDLRAPGDPDTISGVASEAVSWEIGRQMQLQHSLSGNISTPEADFSKRNSSLSGTLALERLYNRDTAGLELRGSVSWLRPLQANARPYISTTSGLFARWNHDISYRWNALVVAGVEQVYTDTGSRPLGFLPSGNAAVLYSIGNAVAGLDVSHGTATNLQVGAISLTDRVGLREVYTFDADKARVLAFSGGYLHNSPLGETALVTAGVGDAMQVDVGFTTQIVKNVIATARYSLAYQFNQGAEIGSTLAHVFLIGVTGTVSTLPPEQRKLPGRGLRVDHSDMEGFPVIDTPRP